MKALLRRHLKALGVLELLVIPVLFGIFSDAPHVRLALNITSVVLIAAIAWAAGLFEKSVPEFRKLR